MSELNDLIAKRDELDKEIAELKRSKRSEAITQAKALIAEFDLTKQELFTKSDSSIKSANAVTAPGKYRDPVTKKTWTGHGKTPKWISESGKDKSEFLTV